MPFRVIINNIRYFQNAFKHGGLTMKTIILIGGYAGSGKTYCSRILSRGISAMHLDKDVLTGPLSSLFLDNLSKVSTGKDKQSRETKEYLSKVRPLEYEIMMNTVMDNIYLQVPIILNAPFISEFRNPNLVKELEARLKPNAEESIRVVKVWVMCSEENMKKRLTERGSERDASKLADWDDYYSKIEKNIDAFSPDYVIDNNSDTSLVKSLGKITKELSIEPFRFK